MDGRVAQLRGLSALLDEGKIPASVAELCRRVAEEPGADLDQLLTWLSPDRQPIQQRLEELITRVRAEAAAAPPSPGPLRR
jgi:hypothetical protein